jgi:predicted membrane protein
MSNSAPLLSYLRPLFVWQRWKEAEAVIEVLMLWIPMCVGVVGAALFRERHTHRDELE